MLENWFTNVFGRPKNKTTSDRAGSQQDSSTNNQTSNNGPAHMTGPFSSQSMTQMPQPPSLPYPPAPYPTSTNTPAASGFYPSLPFSHPPPVPPSGYNPGQNPASFHGYPTGTIARQVSPLDSVPFEARLTLHNSTNLVSLDQLFKDIKKAADVVDRADAYLRSNQSDYDFKVEQNLIYH